MMFGKKKLEIVAPRDPEQSVIRLLEATETTPQVDRAFRERMQVTELTEQVVALSRLARQLANELYFSQMTVHALQGWRLGHRGLFTECAVPTCKKRAELFFDTEAATR